MQITRFHIITQKIPAKYYPFLKELRLEAGRIWSDSLNLFFNLLKQNGKPPKKSQIQKLIKSSLLHSQTTQAIQDRLFGALKSFFKNKKQNPDAKPPKPRRFYNLIWKNQAIRYQNGKLILPLARATGIKLSIPLRKRKREWLEELLRNGAEIRQAEIVFKAFEYRLIILVKETVEINPPDKDKVVALDLGGIHPFVSFDGKEVLIWNGRLLRSYKQLRLKLIALKQKLLAKKQKGSRRWKRIKRSLERQIAKVERKIHLMWRFSKLLQKLKYKFKRFMEKVSGNIVKLPVDGLTRPQGVRYSLSSSGWVLPTLRNPLL